MLLEKVLEMLKMPFCNWVSYPTIKPFIILGVTLFLVMSGKSSEYLLVLRVCSHLLQMDRCVTATVSTAFILRWVMLRTMGMVIPYVSYNAIVGDDHQLALYSNFVWVCVDLKNLLPLLSIWTQFVITVFKLRCNCDANFYVICDGDR
jgi:hypothetical protein